MFAKVENIVHHYIIGTKGWVPRGTATNHLYLHCGEIHLGVGSYFLGDTDGGKDVKDGDSIVKAETM